MAIMSDEEAKAARALVPLGQVIVTEAGQYDAWLDKILRRRQVDYPQPVSPSLAVPLLQAAYDESRPELQELWASLIAAAMDPARSGRVRLSFIDTLKQFDPLDALVLRGVVPFSVETPLTAIAR